MTNLSSFYNKVTILVNERKALDVVYLDFSKDFDTVYLSNFLKKLAAHGLCTGKKKKKRKGRMIDCKE